jgi:hypothetical protein
MNGLTTGRIGGALGTPAMLGGAAYHRRFQIKKSPSQLSCPIMSDNSWSCALSLGRCHGRIGTLGRRKCAKERHMCPPVSPARTGEIKISAKSLKLLVPQDGRAVSSEIMDMPGGGTPICAAVLLGFPPQDVPPKLTRRDKKSAHNRNVKT